MKSKSSILKFLGKDRKPLENCEYTKFLWIIAQKQKDFLALSLFFWAKTPVCCFFWENHIFLTFTNTPQLLKRATKKDVMSEIKSPNSYKFFSKSKDARSKDVHSYSSSSLVSSFHKTYPFLTTKSKNIQHKLYSNFWTTLFVNSVYNDCLQSKFRCLSCCTKGPFNNYVAVNWSF